MTTPASTPIHMASTNFGRGLEGFRHRIPVELQSTGVAELDALLRGGFPRGSLIELCGSSSSGRTGVSFSLLAQATARQETCAFVDVSDSLDPMSLAAAGVDLARLLWIRCGNLDAGVRSDKNAFSSKPETTPPLAMTREIVKRVQGWQHPRDQIRGIENAIPSVMRNTGKSKSYSLKAKPTPPLSTGAPKSVVSQKSMLSSTFPDEQGISVNRFSRKFSGKNKPWKTLEQALKVTDLLLHAGGWGVVVFDFGNISWVDARRIELSTWFRFRRAIENTPTILLLLGEDSCAKCCSSVVLRCQRKSENWSSANSQIHHSELPSFQGFEIEGQILSSRIGLPLMDSAQWIAKSLWANSF
jgi:recombination protein RecA